MNNTSLLDFLIALGTDSELLRRYEQNRDEVMALAGLSPGERALLLQGNQHQLKAAIASSQEHVCGAQFNCPAPAPATPDTSSHSPRPQPARPGPSPAINAPAPVPPAPAPKKP